MTPGKEVLGSTDLNVQDVQDGGIVRGPDPEQITLEFKTISEDEDGKVIEEVVKREWTWNPPPIDRKSPFHEHQEIVSATFEVK